MNQTTNPLGISVNNNVSGASTPAYYQPTQMSTPNIPGVPSAGNTVSPITGALVNNALPSQTLNSTPVTQTPAAHTVNIATPLTPAPSPVDTSTNKLAGYTASTMSQYQTQSNTNDAMSAINYANTSANTNTGQAPQSSDLATSIAQQYGVDPQALMAKLATKGTETANLNTQYQVPEKIQAAQDAYNNYQSASLALNQQIEQIRTTPGITQEQAQQQINEVSKAGNANLANLAVINQAAQGNMTAATNIVQMKLDQEFQPIQDQIDALGKFVTLNNANLTDSQKVQLENQRFVMQNNLNQLMSAKQAAHQYALESGVTDPNVLNAIDQAQTPADAYSAVNLAPDGSAQNMTGQNLYNQLPSGVQPSYRQLENGKEYLDSTNLSGATLTQARLAASKYHIPLLSSEDASAAQDLQSVESGLKTTQDYFTKLAPSNFQGVVADTLTNPFSKLFQTDYGSLLKTYQSNKDNLFRQINAFAGSHPRINTTELVAQASALPTIGDTPFTIDTLQTGLQKLQLLKTNLDNIYSSIIPNAQGQYSSAQGNSSSQSGGWDSLGD